jgi:nicotinate-nucleotide adenylyltransferase
MRVVVLGGSFDPVHLGHLRLAAEARAKLGADRVLLVPAAAQPLKAARRLAPAADRLAMLRLAAAPHPWLEVSEIELDRPGPSYTVDTLRALRADLGALAEIFFVAGADVLRELDRWYRADEIFRLARFVVATRPGHGLEVPPALAGRVTPLEIEALPVSATEVRARLASGSGADDLLPAPVAAYIREHGLYRDGA